MADSFCRVPLPAEVDTFQREISGDQHLVAGRNLEDGAVVSDTGYYAAPSRSGRANAGNQSFLVEGQDVTIKEKRDAVLAAPCELVREQRNPWWEYGPVASSAGKSALRAQVNAMGCYATVIP